jgi:hypothetical protein
MPVTFSISFVTGIVGAAVLSYIIGVFDVETLKQSALVVVLLWLGFTTTVQLNGVLFGDDSLMLYKINTG